MFLSMTTCSIGIFVYNEEGNIAQLLESVLQQKLNGVKIGEIVVISSGSTDKTNKIVAQFGSKDGRIRLIRQRKRNGKSSAVNLFVEKAKNDILVLAGGDIILTRDLIENLIAKFKDCEIGMTGAHPIPLNDIKGGLCSFAAHLLWDLHHRISLKHPKMGEVIAFRKIFKRIPMTSGADEANIEPLIRGQGYKIEYVPDAIIYNKAPTNLSEFIKQRRRINTQHLIVKYEQYYVVSTLNPSLIFRALFSFLRENPRPKFFLLTPVVVAIEAYSRFLGWWDYKILKKRHTIWDPIVTTKELGVELNRLGNSI